MLLKSKKIAYLGILLALNQVFILLSSVIKTNTLLFFMGAALVVAIVLMEFGLKNGVIFYILSAILGFFISFDKIEIFTYIMFFGLYALIKYVIEFNSIKYKWNIIIEYIFKLVMFNVIAVVMITLFEELILIDLTIWIYLIAQLVFVLYDYAFTIFIGSYLNRIRPKLRF